jgi:agmatinase
MFGKLKAQGGRILGIGGDHHVTAAALDAIGENSENPIALLQFDAHADTTQGPDFQHGTMFHHAIHRGLLRPEAIVRIGVRTAHTPDAGLTIGAPETARTDPEVIAGRVLDRLAGHAVYLTFDIDCLDPAFAPGTGTPVPGGLSSLCVLEILRALGREWPNRADTPLVGADLVEVSPPYDHAEITAVAACQILHELCCLFCVTAPNA